VVFLSLEFKSDCYLGSVRRELIKEGNALVAKVVIQIALTHHCRRQFLGFIVEKALKIVADTIRQPPATGGTGSRPVFRT
jgi:hypothetical protein